MPSRLLWGVIWVISLFLLPGTAHVAMGQEPSPPAGTSPASTSDDQGQDVAPEDEDTAVQAEGPEPGQGGEPVQRRRLLKKLGPQQLTQEQQEESTRLSAIAAKMGTDPTAIIGRVQTRYRHNALSGGSQTNSLVGRIDIPYRGDFVLRADVPYLWSDPNQPGATNQNGLSDLFVRAGARLYAVPGYAIFAAMDSIFPTADPRQLGTGKYTVGPLLATARVFPDIDSFLFGVLQHELSVGGDPSRRDISLSELSLAVNTIWGERWWTQVAAATQVNWERNAKTSMELEFEGGYRFATGWGIWVRPGVGLLGQTGAYEWSMETGIRRMFTSF